MQHLRTDVTSLNVLDEIAEATTQATAEMVAAAVGGTRVYVPAQPKADHWLSRLVGHSAALAIGAALAPAQSGLDILIPKQSQVPRTERWHKIHRLIDKGCTKREIARAVGCHERSVQRHRNNGIKQLARDPRQPDFFS